LRTWESYPSIPAECDRCELLVRKLALLNQGMNANRASYPKVSLGLGFKNPTK